MFHGGIQSRRRPEIRDAILRLGVSCQSTNLIRKYKLTVKLTRSGIISLFLKRAEFHQGETDLVPIIVDDHEFMIRQNLWAFMTVFRSHCSGKWMWIDQICINQNDISERGTQVQVMDSIFQGSKATHIWLGLDEHEGLVFQTLSKVRGRCNASCDLGHYGSHESPYNAVLSPQEQEALDCFCQVTYWQRQWVVQELLLSTDRIIWYGTSSMPYADLQRLLVCTEGFYPAKHAHLIGIYAWLIDTMHDNQIRAWVDIFSIARYTKCQDPRDKIFGAQTLIAPEARIKVNYEAPITRTLFDFMLAFQAWCPLFPTLPQSVTQQENYEHLAECCDSIASGMGLIPEPTQPHLLDAFCSIFVDHMGSRASRNTKQNEEALTKMLSEHIRLCKEAS